MDIENIVKTGRAYVEVEHTLIRALGHLNGHVVGHFVTHFDAVADISVVPLSPVDKHR